MSDRISALINRALVSEDEAWLRAEQAVLDAVAAGESVESGGAHADPLGRLLLETARTRVAAGDDDPMRKATQYLDRVEARFVRTAALVPSIVGVVEVLTRAFGPRLTGSFALRLSQQPSAAHWRVMTKLAYLDEHKDPATTDALIRFAARTSLPIHERAAVQVLRELGDPALASKLEAERSRLLAAGRTLSPALASLVGGGGPARA
jgi:hypothetical protein